MSAGDDYKSPFKVFVGIDFGTDGSGLAYSFPNDDGTYSSYIHNMWNSSGATRKPKTSVLCDGNQRKISVGTKAKKMFFQKDGDQEWKLFEKFKMSLYDEPTTKSSLKQADEKFDFVDDLKDEIKSSNDQDLKGTSATVFQIYLKFLKDNAFKFIEKNLKRKLKLMGDKKRGYPEVQYYLTVPAIWSEKAKDRMVQWAIMSGLVAGKKNEETGELELEIPNQIQIVYEPDCASLSLQHAIIRNLNEAEGVKKKSKGLKALQPEVGIKVPFQKGDKYILLDVGGGTCDVACHEIMGEFSIAEVLHPSGGKWGACEIDNTFIELLSKLFSGVLLDIYQMDDQQESYLRFLSNFAIEKEKYYQKHNEDLPEYHDIKMPTNFVTFLIGQFNDEFANNSDRFNYQRALDDLNERIQNEATISVPKNNQSRMRDGNGTRVGQNYMAKIIEIESGNVESDVEGNSEDEFDKMEMNYALSMNNDVWQYLFDHITKPIITHCKKILENPQMKDCKFIFLVGGFANSKYFQERMKKSFGSSGDLSIVVPDLPGLCVVDGASRYGFNNKFVTIRRLPKTYGVASAMPAKSFSKAELERFPAGYVKRHTFSRDVNVNQTEYINYCFQTFVKTGETVTLNDKPITHNLSKALKSQTSTIVKIYCSDKKDPLTCDATEATLLGEIKVDFGNVNGVTIEFHFSSTLLTVYSYPKGKPNKKKRCRVEYL